jgi:hypothetical protein
MAVGWYCLIKEASNGGSPQDTREIAVDAFRASFPSGLCKRPMTVSKTSQKVRQHESDALSISLFISSIVLFVPNLFNIPNIFS